MTEEMRIARWLCAVRLVKTRDAAGVATRSRPLTVHRVPTMI